MHFVGVDLHKQTISVCVVIQAGTTREVIARRRFRCADVDRILVFFEELGQFQVVVEATASNKRGQNYLFDRAGRELVSYRSCPDRCDRLLMA